MITITFFTDEGYTEKEYTGDCMAVASSIDMAEHIKNGGFCMAEYANRAVMITNINQIFRF